jgi:outer membrane receptor protein involved in Fe transport
MAHVTTRYEKNGRRIAFFANLLDGNATNLLTKGITGGGLPLDFSTKTFDVDAADVKVLGTSHVVSYGGNFRHNAFDISLAPDGRDRNEGGAYVQDEMELGRHFRWLVGGRLDKFSSIDNVVFSPRTTFMVKPEPNSTIRFSVNRAFRAPSFINNNIKTSILNEVNLSALSPLLSRFMFPIAAYGNPDLKQESMTAFEIGYTGIIRDRATVTAAVYWNHTKDGIYFTPSRFYNAAAPPPTWPSIIPTAALTALARLSPPVLLPSAFTYLNLGLIKDKGLELGIDAAANRYVNVFANYAYQAMPQVEDFPAGTGINDINWPARNHVNAGANFSYERMLGNLSVNYTDEAYWQDVLDARYAGTTDAFTLVNLGLGVRWMSNRLTTSLKITNLANQQVMQHIFGDVLKRQVVGEARFEF